MRKNLFSAAILFGVLATFNACSTNKAAFSKLTSDTQHAKETAYGCFVQRLDGTIQEYKTLELVTGVFKTPHLLADGKIKINASEIKAYQNKDHYAISQESFRSGHKSNVAIGTLPGFAIRIGKGKLNVYSKKFSNGQQAVDEFFIQSGDNGQVVAYSNEIMTDLLRDDPEAFDFVYSKTSNNKMAKKQQHAAALSSGNTSMLTKNK